jgi:Tautomerase enzyme
MPLLRFDLIEGRSDAELTLLLDTCHSAMLRAFNVPERDRYQIVHSHPASHMIMQDTGLGFERTGKVVFIQVTTRPRSREMKELYYRLTVEDLGRVCGIAPTDVMINLVTCTDEDWSFAHGRAQFLTGEL